MPNREVHVIGAAFVSALVAVVIMVPTGIDYVNSPFMLWLVAGVAGGILPDVFEPGGKGKWNHRKTFHHNRLLKPMLIVTLVLLPISVFQIGAEWVMFLTLGYTVHLAMDSTTKMGLYGSAKHQEFMKGRW